MYITEVMGGECTECTANKSGKKVFQTRKCLVKKGLAF